VRATVLISPLGIFAFDPDNRLIEAVFFPEDPAAVAAKLEALNKGRRLEEVAWFVGKLVDKGVDEVAFEDSVPVSAFNSEGVKAVIVSIDTSRRELLRKEEEEATVRAGRFKSKADLLVFIHDASVALARRTVREESGRRDLMVIQAVQTLDDLDHTFNLFANRLREWYGYSFPEMSSMVSESDLYVRLVASLGGRDSFTADRLVEQGLSEDRSEVLVSTAGNSMGADLPATDLAEMTGFARLLLEFHESRTRLEKYLDSAMQEAAPNTLALLGATLGARLIAITGGIGNLAKRSASTIQVLGAEKALFRSLRSGGRPPKHGLLFQHNDVHQAPRWQRGKIARALASKVAIAARLDAYHGEYLGKQLLKEFEARVEEIRAKYPQPSTRGAKSGTG
jgi:nucleolar protein 56